MAGPKPKWQITHFTAITTEASLHQQLSASKTGVHPWLNPGSKLKSVLMLYISWSQKPCER